MKKLLALLTVTAFSATAQVQLLDGTTPHTNSTTTSANLNVPSKGWTNVPYSTTNYIYIIYGDGLSPTATTKLNSDLVYITNQLALALQLPNQINTNWQTAVATQSNRINVVIINVATVSNNLATTMATVASFPGGNIQNGTVNSNKFTSATLSWLQSMPSSPGYNLLDKYYSYGSANYVPVADGSGQWAWGAVSLSTMNFDSGNITSDGSGNASFVSIFAQQLKDSGYSTGGTDYYAKANGSGGWYWSAWPTTLSYDGGTIYSDGSGNLYAASIKSSLVDNGYSSGWNGYVPVANGDGTWTWGAGSGGSITNIFNQSFYVASNAVVSLETWTALNTNFNVGSSNYLGGPFTNVVEYSGVGPEWTIPSSGMSPGSSGNTPLVFWWSTNGATWTTNLPTAPNLVYASVTCISNGLSSVTITSATHPEANGRTNDLTKQITWVAEPVGTKDAVTKLYCDNQIALKTADKWASDGTNYYYGGVKITVPKVYYNAISTPVIDATGTNYAISIAVTNFIPGWQFQIQTNLAMPFYVPSSYTLTTNSGIATFTIPMSTLSWQMGFFRVVSIQSGAIRFDDPPQINVTTNQIIWGATNAAPANTSTPAAWISVQVSGRTNAYRLPLYQ